MNAPASPWAAWILSAAALAVHAALLAAAPFAAALAAAVRDATGPAAFAGGFASIRLGPRPMLSALLHRDAPVSPGDDPVRAPALLAFLAANLAAYLLVPSFATGMATAALDDGVTVALLLATGLAAAMAADAAGGRAGAIDGLARARIGLALLPAALLLAAFALALIGGGGGLDAAIAAGSRRPPAPLLLAIAALCLAGAADLDTCRALDRALSGRSLALFRAACWVRLMVWLDLVGALCPPRTATDSAAGPADWLAALAAWPVRIAILAALLGLAGRLFPLDRPDRLRGAYGAACLLGLLAAVFVLIGRRLA